MTERRAAVGEATLILWTAHTVRTCQCLHVPLPVLFGANPNPPVACAGVTVMARMGSSSASTFRRPMRITF